MFQLSAPIASAFHCWGGHYGFVGCTGGVGGGCLECTVWSVAYSSAGLICPLTGHLCGRQCVCVAGRQCCYFRLSNRHSIWMNASDVDEVSGDQYWISGLGITFGSENRTSITWNHIQMK